MGERDDPPVGELLDGLSPQSRTRLEECGFDLEQLRRLAATEEGAKRVRYIVSEFSVAPSPEEAQGRVARLMARPGPARPGEVAGHWAVTLILTAVGLTVALIGTVFGGRLLGFGAAFVVVLGLLIQLARTPEAPGRGVTLLLGLLAVAVLFFTGVMNAPQWYLSVRGKETGATLVEPVRTWSHGTRVAHCRVRLPGGAVRQVDRDDRTCADAAGSTVTVVYDPNDRVAPALGGKAGLGTGTGMAVSGGAAALLIGSAVGAVVAAGRRRRETQG